eukprot:6739199-Ditylum_brightwellii.AAC.1
MGSGRNDGRRQWECQPVGTMHCPARSKGEEVECRAVTCVLHSGPVQGTKHLQVQEHQGAIRQEDGLVRGRCTWHNNGLYSDRRESIGGPSVLSTE